MVTRRILSPALAGCAALALLVLPAQSRAGLLMLSFTEAGVNGGAPITITDNMSGDLNPSLNQILALVPSAFTSWSGSASASSNNPGGAAIGTLNLNPNITRLDTNNTAPLLVTATQTGFSLPGGNGTLLSFTSTLAVSGLSAGGTVGLLSSIDSTSTPPQSLAAPGTDSKNLGYNRGATYSLTAQSTINLLNANDTANYSATLTAANVVPAPGGLVLLLAGAPLVVGGYLRRRQKVAVA